MSGRKRWLGHAPGPSEVANGPIQGGAADAMNFRTIEVRKRLKKKYGAKVKIIAQIHDAVIIELPKALKDAIIADIKAVMDKPYIINGKTVKLPIDLKTGYRWSEV